VIICSKCAKENQDHYKFCLGCGAELPRDSAPKAFSPQTPPHGVKAASASAIASAPVAAPSAPAAVAAPAAPAAPAASAGSSGAVPAAVVANKSPCPQCGHMNGPGNLFCGSCGFRLTPGSPSAVAAAAAPVPAAAGSAPAAASAPPPAAAVAPPPAATGGEPLAKPIILTALRADGSEAGTYSLPSTHITVGRETGGIFAADSYLSPRHATFRVAGGRLSVKDEASLNGVYRKLSRDAPVELLPLDVFRIGQEIIKFEPLETLPPSPDGVERLGAPSKGYIGRIALVVGRETTGNAFPVPDTGIHLGRERGEVLFPEDGYVSGLHCRIAPDGPKIYLTDLGSSNGTFLRLREETEVVAGDILLMGQQLFRVSM
jgi:pSer/pThr/pTyr-binding forkhead associated (FHA) protein